MSLPKSRPLMPFYLLILFLLPLDLTAQDLYFPPAGSDWEVRTPSEAGLDEGLINQAVELAMENENRVDRDLRIAILQGFSHEPYHELTGPVRERGGPAGIILKDGYIVASWGDVDRVDMTFSVTKSYLSTVAGLALDRGVIRSIDDRVAEYVWEDRMFDGVHNGAITWEHLLTQSSDWYGTLFGMEDWGDRPPDERGIDDWRKRALNTPGTHFKYNDVRVNLLAYALLQVVREPLPQILKNDVMDPIGASSTWRWFGYDNSWTMIDGQQMQSVSGGGHNGGGIFINTVDQARFGLLFVRGGEWDGRQIVSKDWVVKVQAPSKANPDYGLMWWTLKGDTDWGNVPDHLYYAAGFGGNYIIVDEENDIVIITRWLDNAVVGEFVEMVYQALN